MSNARAASAASPASPEPPAAPDGRSAEVSGYRHSALVWHGKDDFLDRVLPFVRDAVSKGAPTLVALPQELADLVRGSLGATAARAVRWEDIAVGGCNPARLLPIWLDFVQEHRGSPMPLRALSAPRWRGHTAAELAEWELNELLLNVALPADAPLWLLCPYDGALPAEALTAANRSHPEIADPRTPDRLIPYAGHEHCWTLVSQALPEPVGDVTELSFGSRELAAVRSLVRRAADDAGLDTRRAEQLTLAVNELAANSIDHGGGTGVLRVWTEPDALLCEVEDHGVLTDLMVGRITPAPEQPRGRGLYLVNQLCDLTQVRVREVGTVARVVTWL